MSTDPHNLRNCKRMENPSNINVQNTNVNPNKQSIQVYNLNVTKISQMNSSKYPNVQIILDVPMNNQIQMPNIQYPNIQVPNIQKYPIYTNIQYICDPNVIPNIECVQSPRQ